MIFVCMLYAMSSLSFKASCNTCEKFSPASIAFSLSHSGIDSVFFTEEFFIKKCNYFSSNRFACARMCGRAHVRKCYLANFLYTSAQRGCGTVHIFALSKPRGVLLRPPLILSRYIFQCFTTDQPLLCHFMMSPA